jgi:hypothetical protein
MNLDELLGVMDRAAANLAKLEAIWERAEPMIPTGPARGSNREYEDLARAWLDLLPGLPEINGWTVNEELPDIDDAGQAFIDYFEIGEAPFNLMTQLEEPGRQLREYRYRLGQARRRAVRERLEELTSMVDDALRAIVQGVPRDSLDPLVDTRTEQVQRAVSEIERILGDTVERGRAWSDLRRHMHFSQGHDWHDIVDADWPGILRDIRAASLSEFDPLPVPQIDLGAAASSRPAGAATTQLLWASLDPGRFERLVFDIMRDFPHYQNVQWLMKTNAPDGGRDLSAERVISDDGGTTRIERVMVQAKHWTSRSVGPVEINDAVARVTRWEPPVIHGLIVATSGRFTADAVSLAERHNAAGKRPHIELWPENRLESLLSSRPHLVAEHGLRA